MKIIFGVFIGLFLSSYCSAQPGTIYISGNLNEIDSIQVKRTINNEINRFIELGTITIDSTTNLSRIVHLRSAINLNINYTLNDIPKEFYQAVLPNLKSLSIICYNLNDFSKFPTLKNVENLRLEGFKGNILNIQGKFPNLKNLELVALKTSKLEFGKIQSLNIADCKNLGLKKLTNTNSILELTLHPEIDSSFSPNDFSQFTNLERLNITNLDIDFIPKDFSKSIKRVTVSNCNISLDAIKEFSNFISIEELNLNDINSNWKK